MIQPGTCTVAALPLFGRDYMIHHASISRMLMLLIVFCILKTFPESRVVQQNASFTAESCFHSGT